MGQLVLVDGEREARQAQILENSTDLHMQTRAQHDANHTMLLAGPGEWVKGNGYLRLYGDLAVLTITGPIYRHADDAPSGATDTEALMHAVAMLRTGQLTTISYENGDRTEQVKPVRKALLDMDTPGGEATQIDELALSIRELSKMMPTVSFAEGLMASAGFYIGAGARFIVASRMSLVGSMGVVMGVRAPARLTEEGRAVITNHGTEYIEFVSAQSPMKRANPNTPEGMKYFQDIVNASADIFIGDMALFRNRDVATIAEQYGYGGVYVAEEARKRGMVDFVETFENVFNALAQGEFNTWGQSMTGASGTAPALEAHDANGGSSMGKLGEALTRLLGSGGTATNRPANSGQQGRPAGQAPAGEGQTRAQLLEQMQAEREALEQRFTSDALLFARDVIIDLGKAPGAVQEHIVYEMLTAMVDDALLGGTVVFCQLNAEGENEECFGTRAQQIQAKYAAWPQESIAGQVVRDVQNGRRRAFALPPKTERVGGGGRHAGNHRASEDAADPDDQGVEIYDDDDLRRMTDHGTKILEERQNGSRATRGQPSQQR